jgi:uncharacterized transporter YbjL
MKIKLYKPLLITLNLLIVGSCIQAQAISHIFSKRNYFTENSLAELTFNQIDLNDVLFHLSSDVIFRRVVERNDDANVNKEGSVVFDKGKAYLTIKLTSKSTGKFLGKSEDEIKIQFKTDTICYISFVKSQGVNNVSKYKIKIDEGDQINYNGYRWELIFGKNCFLEFKQNRTGRTKSSTDKVRGLNIHGEEKRTIKDVIKRK